MEITRRAVIPELSCNGMCPRDIMSATFMMSRPLTVYSGHCHIDCCFLARGRHMILHRHEYYTHACDAYLGFYSNLKCGTFFLSIRYVCNMHVGMYLEELWRYISYFFQSECKYIPRYAAPSSISYLLVLRYSSFHKKRYSFISPLRRCA